MIKEKIERQRLQIRNLQENLLMRMFKKLFVDNHYAPCQCLVHYSVFDDGETKNCNEFKRLASILF